MQQDLASILASHGQGQCVKVQGTQSYYLQTIAGKAIISYCQGQPCQKDSSRFCTGNVRVDCFISDNCFVYRALFRVARGPVYDTNTDLQDYPMLDFQASITKSKLLG